MQPFEIENPLHSSPPAKEDDVARSSIMVAAFSIVNSMVGAGLLTLSWSFAMSTMWPGIFATALTGFLSALNFQYLGIVAEGTGQHTFNEIWTALYGKQRAWLCDFLILFECIGANIAYLIVIGDFLPRALIGIGIHSTLLQNRRVAITFVLALTLPLNFLKDLRHLGFTSFLGSAGSVYTSAVLFVLALTCEEHAEPVSRIQPGLFVMLPAVSFAYGCHFIAPSAYFELENRTPQRFCIVTTIAFSLSFVLNLICGYSGYYMFGNDLLLPDRSNVLTAPGLDHTPAAVLALLAVTLTVSLSIPLHTMGVRSSLVIVWLNYLPAKLRRRGEQLSNRARHHVVTVLSLALTYTVALFVEDLGEIHSMIGSVTVAAISYILPSLMYLKCNKSYKGTPLRFFPYRFSAYLSICFGFVVGLFGLVTTLMLAAGVKPLFFW